MSVRKSEFRRIFVPIAIILALLCSVISIAYSYQSTNYNKGTTYNTSAPGNSSGGFAPVPVTKKSQVSVVPTSYEYKLGVLRQQNQCTASNANGSSNVVIGSLVQDTAGVVQDQFYMYYCWLPWYGWTGCPGSMPALLINPPAYDVQCDRQLPQVGWQ